MTMKKLTALMLTAVMMLAAVSALAETTITVSGTGETRVSADTAVISLGVNARDKDVQKAQQRVNESIAAIRSALMEQGVEKEDINTEYINIYAVYDYSGDREELAAYNAGSTLAIRVTDIEQVGALIDTAFSAGANTLNGISFSASDTEAAAAESLKRAVENASKKAEILAAASGLEIAGISLVSEGGVFSYENNVGNAYAKGMDMAEGTADAGTVVQAAKLIVSANVNVTYTAEAAADDPDEFADVARADEPDETEEEEEPDLPEEFDDAVDISERFLVGGWSIAEDTAITDEVRAVFEKGVEGLLGVNYVPVAYLGSQLVAGCNHAVLCRATTVYPGAKPHWVIMYLYEDLEGNVSVTEITDL